MIRGTENKGFLKLKPANSKIEFADWGSHLHSIWLKKMALNPGFYDDARESHLSVLSAAVPARLCWRLGERRNERR